MNRTKNLNILHIAHIEDHKFNGVAMVVPNYLKHQAKRTRVALLNIANYIPVDSENTYKTFIYNGESIGGIFDSSDIPDVVIFHEVYRPAYLKIRKELSRMGIPYIITPHVSLTRTAQNHKKFKKLVGNFLYFSAFIRDASAIHYLSQSEKNQSVSFSSAPSFVSGNGIDLKNNQKKSFTKNGLKLIYVGRLEIKIKGIDRIIDAANIMQKDMRKDNIHITLNGYDEANNAQRIARRLQKLGLEDLITLHGPLFGKHKVETILDHDCFIQLSRTEGQPLAIMEAMDIGMPCVVTRGTTFHEKDIFAKETVISVDDDIVEIAKVIKDISRHKYDLPVISRNASEYAKVNFGWDRVARDTINYYGRVISGDLT